MLLTLSEPVSRFDPSRGGGSFQRRYPCDFSDFPFDMCAVLVRIY